MPARTAVQPSATTPPRSSRVVRTDVARGGAGGRAGRPGLAALAVGLALGLFATAARAEGEMVGGRCIADGDRVTTTCPVDLVKGQDYELRGGGDEESGLIELINPAGDVTVSFFGGGGDHQDSGREFRAAYSATYQIRVTSEAEYDYIEASLHTDCRTGVKTKCSLTPGVEKSGRNTSYTDVDWHRATLRKGRTYTFTCAKGPYTNIVLRDGTGRVLKRAHATSSTPGVIRYRAKTSGAYYLETNYGSLYTISVR